MRRGLRLTRITELRKQSRATKIWDGVSWVLGISLCCFPIAMEIVFKSHWPTWAFAALFWVGVAWVISLIGFGIARRRATQRWDRLNPGFPYGPHQ